ncbi:MAG TPA: VanZ family protein [Mycobacteriales bacterium]|nr:VanZ family protein [Mycobacteriales bacterium]
MKAASDDEWPPDEDPGPAWPAARWLLLAIWLGVVGYMTLSAVQPHNGIDSFLRSIVRAVTGHTSALSTTRGAWEEIANVALFVPLGVLVTLVLQRRRRWLAPLLCCAVSVGIEVLQDVVVTTRHASARDIGLNTVGGVIGWLACLPLITYLRHRRRRRMLAG